MSDESTGTTSNMSYNCSIVGTVLDRCCSRSTTNKTSHTLVAICRVISRMLAELVVLDCTVICTILHCRAVEGCNYSAATSCRSRKITVIGTLRYGCSRSCISYDTCQLESLAAISRVDQILHVNISVICTACNCKSLYVCSDTGDACKYILCIFSLEVK